MVLSLRWTGLSIGGRELLALNTAIGKGAPSLGVGRPSVADVSFQRHVQLIPARVCSRPDRAHA